MKLFLNDKLGEISYKISNANDSELVLIIAHGAGAGMHHPFMNQLAESIARLGITTIRFNFPYMEKGRKAPGSPKDAIYAWEAMIDEAATKFPNAKIFMSGKSYGGRMGSHVLVEDNSLSVAGIIYYGFPLHAPGRDSKDRAAHLSGVKTPQLFIQGKKDKLANFEMITEVVNDLPKARIHEIEDGDHSFNVPKRTGISKEEMIKSLAKITVDWIQAI